MSGVDLGIEGIVDAVAIGHGGFATVYRAMELQFDRSVAVKVLDARNLTDRDRNRFDRECKVMGRLSDHPNVVTVFSAGYTAETAPYLMMELVEDGSIADRLRGDGAIGWREAVTLVVPVAGALARAHAEGILHRDIKPANVLLSGNEPKLTDFGIAQIRDAARQTSTHITASWLHAPPETFDNRRDERSDLYSLGSMLYNMVAGHAPFWREGDESLNPLIYRLLNEPLPRLPESLAPPELQDLISRCLAKEPSRRPQSATELTAALETLVAPPTVGPSAPVTARIVPLPVASSPVPGNADPDFDPGRAARSPAESRRPLHNMPLMTAVVGLLALVVSLGIATASAISELFGFGIGWEHSVLALRVSTATFLVGGITSAWRTHRLGPFLLATGAAASGISGSFLAAAAVADQFDRTVAWGDSTPTLVGGITLILVGAASWLRRSTRSTKGT